MTSQGRGAFVAEMKNFRFFSHSRVDDIEVITEDDTISFIFDGAVDVSICTKRSPEETTVTYDEKTIVFKDKRLRDVVESTINGLRDSYARVSSILPVTLPFCNRA